MKFEKEVKDLKKMLFLILFFKKDWFAFRYPMNIFFDKNKPLKDVTWLWEEYNNVKGNLQLYIHSIFCGTRCKYCDCESIVLDNKYHKILYKDYIFSQLDYFGKIIKKEINSIYLGWWTFNLWNDKEIEEFFSKILDNYKLHSNYVWEVEIHPFYLTKNTLRILKDFWVNHIMLGIQTISSKLNKISNRPFDKDKIYFALNEIKRLNFKKVSFDFMYNLPYQTEKELINDMEFIYKESLKLKNEGINLNIEINRWDISIKTLFAQMFIRKLSKEKFFDLIEYYIKQSKKLVKIVDYYIDTKFIDIFDTYREEIEERKEKNTAILWFGLSSTSYIPWKIAYEDRNYTNWYKNDFENIKINYYKLNETDKLLFYVSNNLRKWIPINIFKELLKKSYKFKEFYLYYKEKFLFKWNKVFFETNVDLENDLFNIYLVDDKIRQNQYKLLLKQWKDLWFSLEDLEFYHGMMLDYYYYRNKLYG